MIKNIFGKSIIHQSHTCYSCQRQIVADVTHWRQTWRQNFWNPQKAIWRHITPLQRRVNVCDVNSKILIISPLLSVPYIKMTRKCSVIGCRTGYKTTKQEKEDGKGNFIKGTVFGFPKNQELSVLWEKFLGRNDFFVCLPLFKIQCCVY